MIKKMSRKDSRTIRQKRVRRKVKGTEARPRLLCY